MTGIEVVTLLFRLELCVIWIQSSHNENTSNKKRWGGGEQEKSNHALDEYSHRCFLCLFSHKYGGTAKIHMAKNL